MRSAIFALFCVTLAAQSLPYKKEEALGKALAEQVRRSSNPVGPQAVQDYVSQLGARLAAQLPTGAFPKTISVVDFDRTNPLQEPVVLPGGYIFVPLGLLLAAQDEAEFAGMLAQAMAREPLELALNDGPIPLFYSGGFPTIMPVSVRNEQSRIELQADATAAAAMARAGFDPAALLSYIERGYLEREQRPDPFSQLPPRAVRIEALRKTIEELPLSAEYIEDSSDFAAVKKQAHAEGLEPPRRSRPSLNRQ